MSALQMIAAISLVIALSAPTYEQNVQDLPLSRCPSVYQYERIDTGPPLKWYGVINLTSDIPLHSLLLHVVFDRKADDIVGNWIENVTTKDNKNFTIENSSFKISPGAATPIRFFVQYNSLEAIPEIWYIKLNGKTICKPRKIQVMRNRDIVKALYSRSSNKSAVNFTTNSSST